MDANEYLVQGQSGKIMIHQSFLQGQSGKIETNPSVIIVLSVDDVTSFQIHAMELRVFLRYD